MNCTRTFFVILLICLLGYKGMAQSNFKSTKDTVSVHVSDTTGIKAPSKEGKNRNLMLNAESNSAPRDVNIGLPASVGGITIYENGLPVVYFLWPELPYYAWSSDATINRVSMLGMSEMAITNGDVGYALSSYDNLGGGQFHLNGSLNTSHYGLLKGTFNISGPLGKGWEYSFGGYINRDPKTYDLGFTDYSERSNSVKVGLTRKFNNNKGQISLLYKYSDYWGLSSYAPFKYEKNGEVKQLDNFDIGRDSYVPIDGTMYWKNALTGEGKDYDLSDAGKTHSHSLYLLGNYNFDSGLKFDYSVYYHNARAGMLYIYPTSTTTSNSSNQFTYLDSGENYDGTAQMMFAEYIPSRPVSSLMSYFELSKKNEEHSWRLGLNEWHYRVNKFQAYTALYYQETAPQPKKLAYSGLTDEYGEFGYNTSAEYHNGYENKLSLYAMDQWKVNSRLVLNGGIRLMYHKINGDYNTQDRGDYALNDYATTSFDHNWFYKKLALGGYYRLTKNYGLTAQAIYNEEKGRLENYSGSDMPALKKVATPMGQFGFYLNGKKINMVSSLTYIKKTNYQKRITLYNPSDETESEVKTIYYDVQTLGWTTDLNANPFKNFSLHYRLTVQKPQYKNFEFSAFNTDYDYSNNTVTEVPKILMEIDPSYSFAQKFRLWVSGRYYSKQYENVGNAIYFKPHWETFGGMNYKINKNFDFAFSVTNLLNQKGAKGSISGADLVTDASSYYGTVMAGSYILPFTCKFDLNFHF